MRSARRAPGARLLVKYRGEPLYHERFLGVAVGDHSDHWAIGALDFDVYDETFVIGPTFEDVMDMLRDRSLPGGLDEEGVYLFYNPCTADGDLCHVPRVSGGDEW